MSRVSIIAFLAVFLMAEPAAPADQYPAGLREYPGQFSFCEDVNTAMKLAEVRAYGLAVAEDQLQMFARTFGKSGQPLCRADWIDLRQATFIESIDLGVISPIDSRPFYAWIVGVHSDAQEYWILWFVPLKAV